MAPFPQLVYNGVFAMNPFTRTVNFTAQVERAARPFAEAAAAESACLPVFPAAWFRGFEARSRGDGAAEFAALAHAEIPAHGQGERGCAMSGLTQRRRGRAPGAHRHSVSLEEGGAKRVFGLPAALLRNGPQLP